jgi:carbon storage regulator CsrA
MSNLILTRKAGQCVRLEMLPGAFVTLIVAYVGGDQVKFNVAGSDGSNLTKRVNVGDSLPIGDEVVVTVTSINFRVVRLAFNAPLSVKIVRTELLERAS